MGRKRHNPEKREWKGRSYKKGGDTVSSLRGQNKKEDKHEIVIESDSAEKQKIVADKLRALGFEVKERIVEKPIDQPSSTSIPIYTKDYGSDHLRPAGKKEKEDREDYMLYGCHDPTPYPLSQEDVDPDPFNEMPSHTEDLGWEPGDN